MPWECLNCGKYNNDALVDCEKCLLNKATATSLLAFPTRKKFCEECGHKHIEKTYCHVYRAVTADDIEEEEEEEEEERSNAGSDDDSAAVSIGKAKTEEVIEAPEDSGGIKPLPTPKFVSRIYYMRCNCLVGVPSSSRRFEPVPAKLVVGDILVKFYEDALELFDSAYNENHKEFHFRKLNKKAKREMTAEEAAQYRSRCGEILPLVCRFLPVGIIANPAVVCKAWNYGVSLYREYVDIRDAIPWNVVKSHEGQVDTILLVDRVIYSGADRQVFVTDMERGEVISKVMRDSGDIRYLAETEHELFCCSSNGSIRSYLLTHDHTNPQLCKTMWEHSRSVLKLMYDLPTQGPCELHGINGHRCFMYTISDDRYKETIKQWSTTRYLMSANIQCNQIRQFSYSCLTQSERHLIAGTTGASIMVFSKFNVCERSDVHSCNNPGAKKEHCLQVTLKLPKSILLDGNPPIVSGIACCGPPNNPYGMLWAGDTSGRLLVWEVPVAGLHFVPMRSWRPHTQAITALVHTYKHVITCGDDGCVVLFEMTLLVKIRCIDIQAWAMAKGLMLRSDIPRRIKCMNVCEDHARGGLLALGTSYGEVVIISIGTYV